MQKRGVDSPDNADALCLTFAAHVPPAAAQRETGYAFAGGGSWMA